MARGQRKTLEEKIQAKQELITALKTRIESEQRELDDLFEEKHKRELETVSDLIADTGLNTEEVASLLRQYMNDRSTANAS